MATGAGKYLRAQSNWVDGTCYVSLIVTGLCLAAVGVWLATHYPVNHSSFDFRYMYPVGALVALIGIGYWVAGATSRRLAISVAGAGVLLLLAVFVSDQCNLILTHAEWIGRRMPRPFE
jgi:hypothetical protein